MSSSEEDYTQLSARHTSSHYAFSCASLRNGAVGRLGCKASPHAHDLNLLKANTAEVYRTFQRGIDSLMSAKELNPANSATFDEFAKEFGDIYARLQNVIDLGAKYETHRARLAMA